MAGSLCITAQHANFHANFKSIWLRNGLGNLASRVLCRTTGLPVGGRPRVGCFRYDGEKFESAWRRPGIAEYWPRVCIAATTGGCGWARPRTVLTGRAFRGSADSRGVAEIGGREAIGQATPAGRYTWLTPAGPDGGRARPLSPVWPDAGAARGEPGGQSVSPKTGVVGCGREICRWERAVVWSYGAAQGVPADEWPCPCKDLHGRLYARGTGDAVELVPGGWCGATTGWKSDRGRRTVCRRRGG